MMRTLLLFIVAQISMLIALPQSSTAYSIFDGLQLHETSAENAAFICLAEPDALGEEDDITCDVHDLIMPSLLFLPNSSAPNLYQQICIGNIKNPIVGTELPAFMRHRRIRV